MYISVEYNRKMTQSRGVIYEKFMANCNLRKCVQKVNCRSVARIPDCFAIIDFRFV